MVRIKFLVPLLGVLMLNLGAVESGYAGRGKKVDKKVVKKDTEGPKVSVDAQKIRGFLSAHGIVLEKALLQELLSKEQFTSLFGKLAELAPGEDLDKDSEEALVKNARIYIFLQGVGVPVDTSLFDNKEFVTLFDPLFSSEGLDEFTEVDVSGATRDFMLREFCRKHKIEVNDDLFENGDLLEILEQFFSSEPLDEATEKSLIKKIKIYAFLKANNIVVENIFFNNYDFIRLFDSLFSGQDLNEAIKQNIIETVMKFSVNYLLSANDLIVNEACFDNEDFIKLFEPFIRGEEDPDNLRDRVEDFLIRDFLIRREIPVAESLFANENFRRLFEPLFDGDNLAGEAEESLEQTVVDFLKEWRPNKRRRIVVESDNEDASDSDGDQKNMTTVTHFYFFKSGG